MREPGGDKLTHKQGRTVKKPVRTMERSMENTVTSEEEIKIWMVEVSV